MIRFKELRLEHNLYQKDLAELLNCTQAQYSRIESGINQASYEQLIKLAKYYNTSIDYILGLTKVKEPYER